MTALPSIPGLPVHPNLSDSLRKHVASLMHLRDPSKFPGAQPISFSTQHIDRLKKEFFYVSEKADGTRCLMYTRIVEGNSQSKPKAETFLIDRKNNYYFLEVPLPKVPAAQPRQLSDIYHNDTILDGELVEDTDPRTGKKTRWFLWFDCLVLDGHSLTDRPYDIRLGKLIAFVEKPYLKLIQKDGMKPDGYGFNHPFRMKVKKLELSYGMKSVFDSIPHLHHKSDGIIFTSKTAPYRIGTCEDMIKWKPADENTVDFKIRKVGPFHAPRFILQIWDGDSHFDLAELTLDDELQAEWSRFPPNDRIVECRYDPDWKNNWRFMRFRDDKANANHTSTFDKVMQSIKDGIDKATLLNEIPAIKANWKEREARLKEEKESPQPPPPATESRSNGIAPDQQGHIHVRGSNSSNGNGIKRTRNENETDNNGDQHHTKKVKAMAETNGSLEDNTQGVGETVQESNNESEVDEVEEEADENEDEFYELDEEDADEE